MAATESDTTDEQPRDFAPERDLSHFQYNILGLLASYERDDDPQYGLRLKEDLEDYYEKEVFHGRLYPNIDTLVGLGLIEKGSIDRRTNWYKITDAGKATLRDLREWISGNTEDLL